ncbi:MAG TPA: hypothetical protein ENI27_03605 [bacterium]|nr:hypothetical protein [bacterium]
MKIALAYILKAVRVEGIKPVVGMELTEPIGEVGHSSLGGGKAGLRAACTAYVLERRGFPRHLGTHPGGVPQVFRTCGDRGTVSPGRSC